MSYELVFVDAVKARTDAAFLFEISDDEFWCPRSAIDNPDELDFDQTEMDFGNTSMDVYIEAWWLEKQGLL